jgi:hypothetical protein
MLTQASHGLAAYVAVRLRIFLNWRWSRSPLPFGVGGFS